MTILIDEIREINPLTVIEFIKLDIALEHELWLHRYAAEESEAYASVFSPDDADAQIALMEAKRNRTRAYELADLLLMLRQRYLVHPEDPHDLL